MTTVRLALANPLLVDSFETVPGQCGRLVDVGRVDGATYRLLIRTSIADVARFETALGEDDTVVNWTRLATGREDGLYRIRVGADRMTVRAYRHAIRLDGYLVQARVDADGWHLKLLFPDRGAASALIRRCEADGMEPNVRAIRDAQGGRAEAPYDLTEVQAETLRAALECGYFAVPRRATLDTLAEGLGVSKQAVSERLRRGLGSLLRDTVAVSNPVEPGTR